MSSQKKSIHEARKARKSSGLPSELMKAPSIDSRVPEENPFENEPIGKPVHKIVSTIQEGEPQPPTVVKEYERNMGGTLLLLIWIIATVIRMFAVFLLITASVAADIFASTAWTVFVIFAGGISILLLSVHLVYCWDVTFKPGYIDKPIDKVNITTMIIQVVYHFLFVLSAAWLWSVAFKDENVSPIWAAAPAFMLPFVIYDVVLNLLIRRRKKHPLGMAAKLVDPFSYKESFKAVNV